MILLIKKEVVLQTENQGKDVSPKRSGGED